MIRRKNTLLGRHFTSAPAPDERGNHTIQGLIIWPLVFLFFLGIIQYALVYFGTGLAHDAAMTALTEARREDGTAYAGQLAGNEAIKKANLPALIQNPTVTIQKTATTVTVSVTGKSLSWVPGFSGFDINETISAPVERWVPRS